MTNNWTPQQTAIFNWFAASANFLTCEDERNTRALIVEAVAGSGKTTTIVHAASFIPECEDAIFCAFNKSIADTLRRRLPRHVESKTLNALGFRALRDRWAGLEIETGKTRQIILDLIAEGSLDNQLRYNTPFFRNLLSKIKAHGYGIAAEHPKALGVLNEEVISDLVGHYCLNLPERLDLYDILTTAEQVLYHGHPERCGMVDFDDQLYLPVVMDLPVKRYDWFIVDEAQDVSHIQRELIVKSLKDPGRFIAVGDRYQSIYGFRGADSDSMDNLAELFETDHLPLSVTWRCPVDVVSMAKAYCPDIENAEGAEKGLVEYWGPGRLLEILARENDPNNWDSGLEDYMVLCRNLAPLVSLAYRLIGNGIPAQLPGRDIGKSLAEMVKSICGWRIKSINITEYQMLMEAWRARKVKKLAEKDDDAGVEALMDRVGVVDRIIDLNAARVNTPIDLVNEIEALFDKSDGVTLSTIHRAKGLEAPNVVVYEPHLMPSAYARTPAQMQQERNLTYVAYTRAQKQLVFVSTDG